MVCHRHCIRLRRGDETSNTRDNSPEQARRLPLEDGLIRRNRDGVIVLVDGPLTHVHPSRTAAEVCAVVEPQRRTAGNPVDPTRLGRADERPAGGDRV